MTMTSAQITIITGRFGSGKTEIALNYALRLAQEGHAPLLIDLDIVTPYFRTRDLAARMAEQGVQVVAPHPVGQHLHIPALSPQIGGAIEQREQPVVIDLGGDVQGARALAQYAHLLAGRAYAMLFVVNPYRLSTDTVDGIAHAIAEIQASAHACVSHLVSNPNLMSESDPACFAQGHRLVERASEVLGLPIAFAVAADRLASRLERDSLGADLMVIQRFLPMFDS
ncbi:MAG: hypothetical protein JXA09_04560 [Anaerolineae bacterium]|nr:hypothetical protein [Anaerolineae bacterium]